MGSVSYAVPRRSTEKASRCTDTSMTPSTPNATAERRAPRNRRRALPGPTRDPARSWSRSRCRHHAVRKSRPMHTRSGGRRPHVASACNSLARVPPSFAGVLRPVRMKRIGPVPSKRRPPNPTDRDGHRRRRTRLPRNPGEAHAWRRLPPRSKARQLCATNARAASSGANPTLLAARAVRSRERARVRRAQYWRRRRRAAPRAARPKEACTSGRPHEARARQRSHPRRGSSRCSRRRRARGALRRGPACARDSPEAPSRRPQLRRDRALVRAIFRPRRARQDDLRPRYFGGSRPLRSERDGCPEHETAAAHADPVYAKDVGLADAVLADGDFFVMGISRCCPSPTTALERPLAGRHEVQRDR